MDQHSRNRASSRVKEAGRRLDEKLSQAEERIQQELGEIITYLDEEVVPQVRQHSSRTLRELARKMADLADYMDKHTPPKP